MGPEEKAEWSRKDCVKENLEDWLGNPSWRAYYEEAPSGKCRELIALEFYYSEYEMDETVREMETIEGELALEDWRYLYRHCGNNPRKKMIRERMEELEEKSSMA